MSVREFPEAQEQAEHDQRAAAYKIPVPRYTVAIIACLGLVFAVQLYVDAPKPDSLGGLLFHELITSAYLAGFVKPAFFQGEYWRILTGAFVHGFVLHIAMNSYAFYSFGKLFELLTNRAHVPIVFLLSAIVGGIFSAYFLPDGISVGASGGIVGLIGYLLIYAFRRRRFVSQAFRKSLLFNIGFILLIGFTLRNYVDNWGHIGGLVAGAVYGLFQIPSDEYTNPQEAGHAAQVAGLVALGICVAASVFTVYLLLGG